MTTSSREQLKKEICSYFLKSGVSREALPKAIAVFKECADDGREFESCFASRHHVVLQDFQKRYWALDDSLLNATSSEMSKVDAEEIFADPQSSPSLLRAAAARVLAAAEKGNDELAAKADAMAAKILDNLSIYASPSKSKLYSAAVDALEGRCTFEQAVERFENRKIVIKKSC